MPRTQRRDLRVTRETDQFVRQAATTANTTLTDFVVDAAVAEAERVLADRTQVALDPVQASSAPSRAGYRRSEMLGTRHRLEARCESSSVTEMTSLPRLARLLD